MSNGYQVIPTDDFSPFLSNDDAAHFVHLNGYIGGDISWAVTRSYGYTNCSPVSAYDYDNRAYYVYLDGDVYNYYAVVGWDSCGLSE